MNFLDHISSHIRIHLTLGYTPSAFEFPVRREYLRIYIEVLEDYVLVFHNIQMLIHMETS